MSASRMATLAGPAAAAASVTAFIGHRRRVNRRWIGALTIGLAATIAVTLGIGPVAVHPGTVLAVIGHEVIGLPGEASWPEVTTSIVWHTRAPRVAMAVVAGAVLAVAGSVLQALVRNGLADPYVLGLNSGASTGAALVILVFGSAGALHLAGGALMGAAGAIVLVLLLAGTAGQRGPGRLVLSGLAVGYALSAVTSFLIFSSDSPEAARSVMFWLLGSLASVQPLALLAAAVVAVLGIIALTTLGPVIDALASGDDSALSAGIDPERGRFTLMISASVMVGVVVAGVGGVGFVGLVVPHLARRLVGGRHRAVLPVSALIGAILLLAADTVARTAFSPHEIPVGVITGIVGAPILLILLRRSRMSTTS